MADSTPASAWSPVTSTAWNREPRSASTPPPRPASPHERFRTLHQPAHRHLAADGGSAAGGRGGVSVAAGSAPAAGGFPHHPGDRTAARREPGDQGGHGG